MYEKMLLIHPQVSHCVEAWLDWSTGGAPARAIPGAETAQQARLVRSGFIRRFKFWTYCISLKLVKRRTLSGQDHYIWFSKQL